MNFISNYFSENLKKKDITNSLIFYLYSKNHSKYKYFKSTHKIKTSYIDPVLQDSISVSTNGFKKSSFFRRPELNENILSSNLNNFVCYFSLLEDDIFKFNLYPIKYLNVVASKFLKKQQLILFRNKVKLSLKKKKVKSYFYSNYLILDSLKKNPILGNFSKSILVKSLYKKLFFCSDRGFVKKFRAIYDNKLIFQGLNIWTNKTFKRWFRKILVMNFLLFKFYSNVLLNWKKDFILIYNIYIYEYYYRFLNHKFYTKLEERRFQYRRKNTFLRRYQFKFKSRLQLLLKFYYIIVIKKYFYQSQNYNWFNDILFNKVKHFLSPYSEEIDYCILQNKVNPLSFNDRIKILTFLFNYIKANFLVTSCNEESSLLIHYLYRKSLLIKNYILFNFPKLQFFYNKNIFLYLSDLTFGKVLNYLQSNFTIETNFFFNKVFNWQYSLKRNKFLIKNSYSFKYLLKKNLVNFKKKGNEHAIKYLTLILKKHLKRKKANLSRTFFRMTNKKFYKKRLYYSLLNLLRWKKWLKRKSARFAYRNLTSNRRKLLTKKRNTSNIKLKKFVKNPLNKKLIIFGRKFFIFKNLLKKYKLIKIKKKNNLNSANLQGLGLIKPELPNVNIFKKLNKFLLVTQNNSKNFSLKKIKNLIPIKQKRIPIGITRIPKGKFIRVNLKSNF